MPSTVARIGDVSTSDEGRALPGDREPHPSNDALAGDTGAAPEPAAAAVPPPSLAAPGAVPDPQGATALHFGDPFAEQRAAARDSALVDRSDREFIEITGPERLTWLEGFISQHVTELSPGQSTESLVLDANGRVEHHFGVTATEDALLLDTPAGAAEALFAFLDRMVFWAEVTPRLAPEYALLTVVGPDALRALAPLDDGAEGARPGWLVARRAQPGSAGDRVDLVVSRPELRRAWDAVAESASAVMGAWGWNALRVAELLPSAADLDGKTIPHEVPSWIGGVESGGAVHLDKGCYRGQETVSRVHNLGRAPRALVRLMLDGTADELPAPDTEVKAGARTVGRLGTAVQHFELGPIALALVKRNVGADIELTVGDAAASIDPDSLPDDSGPQAGREAIDRLRKG